MQIYVHRNGQQLGPLTEADVRAQLAAGTLSPQDHVWWQGQATWIQLQQSPFAPLPPLPGLGPAATLPSPFPGAPPVSFTVPHSAQSSDFATWSMVCGIFCVFCGLLAAIPAIVFGHLARAQIKKNPTLQGRGQALAGLIIGYLVLVITLLIFIAYGVLYAMGAEGKTALTSESNDSDQNTTNSAPVISSPDDSTNSTTPVTP